jgi:hypothetical protein
MIDMACLRYRKGVGIGCLMLAAWLSFAPTVSTTSVVPLTFDELLAEAATIVRGEVTDVRSEWRDRQPGSGPIVTFVTVRVQQTLKGGPSPQLLLQFLGGTVGDQTLTVAEMPQFKIGDRDILFINDAGRPASPIVGVFLGRFTIKVDAFTGREFVTTFDGRPLSDAADIGGAPAKSLSAMRAPTPGAALSVAAVETLIRQRLQPK